MFANKKKSLALFMSVMMIVSVIVGLFPGNTYAEEVKASKELTIVHVNDVHGRVYFVDEKFEKALGYAKLKTYVDDLKKEGKQVILLNAGDTVHGTPFATLSEGESVIKLMNEVGFDAMAPGNHDYNYGTKRLLELNDMADFEIIAANFVKEGTKETPLKPYIIKEVDGVKVGIFGLATDETKVKAHPKYTEGYDFLSPVEVSKEMVKKLREDEKVDVVIAVSHLGIDKESKYTSELVAKEVEGIDLIIDGHSHSDLPEGMKVKDTVIAQAFQWTTNIGVVDIKLDDNNKAKDIKASVVTFEEGKAIKEDEKIAGEIAKVQEENNKKLNRVIGKTLVKLDGEREIVRGKESNLGNFASDAIREITGADIAITNGGGIRESIPAGDITVGNIYKVFPFANYPVTIKVTGENIVKALEHGTTSYPELAGGFPQVSGIKYDLDLNQPVGSRVKAVAIDGKPVDLKKEYVVATNDFMAAGGDGYSMFSLDTKIAEFPLMSETLVEYIEKEKEISPKVENRLNVIEKVAVEKPVEEVKKEEVKEVVKPVEEKKVETKVEETKVAVKKYVVKSGDVLWKIARSFGTTWQRIAEHNGIKNPNKIYPGQVILIP